MLEALLVVPLALIAVALIVLLDRALHRAAVERTAHRHEVARLLQRIQAPEQAVYEHATGGSPPPAGPPAARYDDDESYWQATESKEQLAERLLRDELAQRVTSPGGED
jgi:hypothetical protein